MAFDPCPHQITQIVIKAGILIRQLKGLPEERNITKLYNETAPLLDIPIVQMTSQTADHLPSPAETGPFFKCPKCGEEKLVIDGLCPSCKDSEGGKYLSKLYCPCGFEEKSPKPQAIQWMEHGYQGPLGMKIDIGMKTITDDGRK